MNVERIASLYILFSGDTSDSTSLIREVVDSVIEELTSDADQTDDRLTFYCAARANLRYFLLKMARGQINTDKLPLNTQIKLTEDLVKCYRCNIEEFFTDSSNN